MIDSATSFAASSKVIDDLYAGTLDVRVWNRAISGIANSVRASGAFLVAFDPRDGAFLRHENHRLDPRITTDCRKRWTHDDTQREYLLSLPTCAPVTEWMLPMEHRWQRSRLLNHFLAPADIPHFMLAWIHKAPNKVVSLSVQGTGRRGPFELGDLETYRMILPHVRRTLEIRDRLEGVLIREDTLAKSLHGRSVGVLALDYTGKLLDANALARQHLQLDDGLHCKPDGTLRLREPAGSQLIRWVTTQNRAQHTIGGLLHVPRSSASDLSVVVSRISARGTSWITRDPRWLLLIFDPEHTVVASAAIIARDLNVSAKEAKVAALLVAGCNLKTIAERAAVSEHTVRCQLKSVFRKAGIHSQSELVRRVVLGPAMHRER